MNKKLLISMISLVVLAFAAGIGTYALFTDTTESTGNSFNAGYVRINLGTTDSFITNPDPMKVGDTITGDVVVNNKKSEIQSNLASTYTLTANSEASDDNDNLYKALYVKITKDNPTVEDPAHKDTVYDGYVHDLVDRTIGELDAKADSDNLHFTISLPTLAGNNDEHLENMNDDNILQGKTASIKFTFNAQQE